MPSCRLFQNYSTARSIAPCGKSSQIASSTDLSSALLVGFGVNTLYRSSLRPRLDREDRSQVNLMAIHHSSQTLDYAARSILERGEMNELVHSLAEIQIVWQQSFTVLEELRKQIIHVEICSNLYLFWHEVKPTLASKPYSCRHHNVWRKLGLLDQYQKKICLLNKLC